MVELRELVHVLPDLPVGGMENVRAVFVHMDSLYLLTINISRNMIPPVNDQAALPPLMQLMCHDCAIQSGTHDQIIILHNQSPYFVNFKCIDASCTQYIVLSLKTILTFMQ